MEFGDKTIQTQSDNPWVVLILESRNGRGKTLQMPRLSDIDYPEKIDETTTAVCMKDGRQAILNASFEEVVKKLHEGFSPIRLDGYDAAGASADLEITVLAREAGENNFLSFAFAKSAIDWKTVSSESSYIGTEPMTKLSLRPDLGIKLPFNNAALYIEMKKEDFIAKITEAEKSGATKINLTDDIRAYVKKKDPKVRI